jgi:hypothetical protein
VNKAEEPTSFEVDEVLDDVLHELILSDHVPLKVHHFPNHGLVVGTQVAHVLLHRLLRTDETIELTLETVRVETVCRVRRIHRAVPW